MTDSPTNRVPAGVPTGGQFAAKARSEAEVHLHSPVVVEDSEGDPRTITPGVLDDEAKALYADGPQSLALAAAIAHEKDWDVVVTYANDHDDDGEHQETRILDAFAQAPAGAGAPLVTVEGLEKTYNAGGSEWLDNTRYDVEIIPRPSRSDLLVSMVADWTDAPTHGPLARTFAKPVLAAVAKEREAQARADLLAAAPGDRLYDEDFDAFTRGADTSVRYYDGCPMCQRAKDAGSTFFPMHKAMPNCRSGGSNHCSCDTCF